MSNDLINQAVQALYASLGATMGVQVAYTHGSVTATIEAIPSIPPRMDIKTLMGGLDISVKDKDWIIRYNDLGFIPAVGDTIVYNDETWKVCLTNSESCFHWSDPNKSILRIHTKQMGAIQ